MRAAAADVVPFKFVPYGLALREHVDELRLIHARRVRKADPATGAMSERRVRRACQPWSMPCSGFQAQAEELDQATAAVAERDQVEPLRAWRQLNDALAQVERAFSARAGPAGRPWFKHAIYAPGLTTGYAAWPLPAIRQALEDKSKEQLARRSATDRRADQDRRPRAMGSRPCKHAQAVIGEH